MKDPVAIGILVSALVYGVTNAYNTIRTTVDYIEQGEQVQMHSTMSEDNIKVELTYNKNQICDYPKVELKKDE